jgi:hypothetical protein
MYKKKGQIMGKWLNCIIYPGLFDEEFAVEGNLFDGTGFSLFAEKEDLRYNEEPAPNKPVNALIRVVPGLQKDDLLLVTLPKPTFENGQTITVKTNQVKDL